MNIYVGNLSYQVTAENVRQTFETFGQVGSATLSKDKYSGQQKGVWVCRNTRPGGSPGSD